MPKLTINGQQVTVEPGTTVLQACQALDIEIPHFCYHERLSIAGNCRMCLVEMEKSPKPIASCAMPAGDGMVIHTDSLKAKKAREGVMEFLLINHPLDCPICDQGGECDLQDQAMAYGRDGSRFTEAKRAVKDKDLGPLIKTIMTRCIHCTRCVRFGDEIAGVPELGATGRGEHMEIGTYVERAVSSELSGNMIDICPVGALTSKPFAFHARSWELLKIETVDVFDAVGSNIRVDTRGREVMRILPRLHEDINEEWIADKTRFAGDGLKRQRLDRPLVRRDGRLREARWDEAFGAIATRLKGRDGRRIAAIVGDLADCESIVALKDLMARLGSPHLECRQDAAKLDASCRAGYLFNTTIAGIEQADALLLVGTNPRWEAALINARIRKAWRQSGGDLKIAGIGAPCALTYRVEWLGRGPETLRELVEGRHSFAATLNGAARPMLIVGQGALARPDGAQVLHAARSLAERCGLIKNGWNGFNVLHTAAGRVGALDLGFVPGAGGRDLEGIFDACRSGKIDTVFLLGADEFDMARLSGAFVIYQGHHGDAGAHRADVILPGAAFTEKHATYVNTEGRPQRGVLAVNAPGEAREDWRILRALSEALGARLPYDTLDEAQRRMAEIAPHLSAIDRVETAAWGAFGAAGAMGAAPFRSPIDNYYMTDPISRASETMAECTRAFVANRRATGTDGR